MCVILRATKHSPCTSEKKGDRQEEEEEKVLTQSVCLFALQAEKIRT